MKTDHNILFFTYNYAGRDAKGGTEIRTLRTVRILNMIGRYRVFHAYKKGKETEGSSVYEKCIKLKPQSFVKDLTDFLSQNQIDVVVNEGDFFRHNRIYRAIKKSGRDIKILFVHHFAPGSEMQSSRPKALMAQISNGQDVVKNIVRLGIHPLYYMRKSQRLKHHYRKVYKNADGIFLWSDKFIWDYTKFSGVKDTKKFYVVPGYVPKNNMSNYLNKERRVLVLSRMDETYKRISLALKVWKKIEKDYGINDWVLDIVGTGPQLDYYKRLSKKLGLKNITFHGWQPREIFLERSAIFLLTSRYEGMGLSLLEAMSYGCVPMAFNTFSSLSDAVDSGQNGVVVEKFGDIKTYAEELVKLIQNRHQREFMSSRAMLKVEKYNAHNVGRLWMETLDYISPATN